MPEYIDTFDWARFTHANGQATDTPGHLRALLDESDAKAFMDGYSHLWSETLRREGGAWPVTAPVALVLTEFVDDPRLGPDDPSLLDAVLASFHRVAVAGDLGEDAAGIRARGEQPEALACHDAVPVILAKVLPHLGSDRPQRRSVAAAAVGRLARHPAAASQRGALTARLEEMAQNADAAYERATSVFAIGDLGGTPRHWLDEPNPAVRGCAALAETLADDAAATNALLALSRAPRAFAASLDDMAEPVQFAVPPFRDLVAEAVVRRVRKPSLLLPSALAAVDLRPSRAIVLLATYLRAFFPDGDPQAGVDLFQHALAASIAARDELWSLPEHRLAALFGPCGLSARRADWAAMADRAPQPPPGTRPAAHIVVLEGSAVIRRRPGMYFDVERTDPDLPEHIVAALRTEFARAVEVGAVGSFTIEVESPTRLVLDVVGHELPGSVSMGYLSLDRVVGQLSNPWPADYLSLACALCRRVGIRAWLPGRVIFREYVDRMPLGVAQVSAADESRTGYQVVFDLDTDWFPAGSRFKSA